MEKEDAFETTHIARIEAEELQPMLNEEMILQETLCQEVARVTTEAKQQLNSLHTQGAKEEDEEEVSDGYASEGLDDGTDPSSSLEKSNSPPLDAPAKISSRLKP
ncbi:uncharacterized protein A4U43_C05F20460 [Asparagus officinalis]|uniref:Uncharacterized protein n=1 Tax=Asparagus officinalis TaxID=4686 RepID=A0A5P1EVL2_ASPOF|nr:uncharacterized protein A4U43_C05F20460 [Asparagus officinalis]